MQARKLDRDLRTISVTLELIVVYY